MTGRTGSSGLALLGMDAVLFYTNNFLQRTLMHIYRTTEPVRTAAHIHPDLKLRPLMNNRIQSLEAFDDLPDDLAYLLQVLVLQAGAG